MTLESLSPSLWTTTKVFAHQILNATAHATLADTFVCVDAGCILVKTVALLGLIVAREEKSAFVRYAIDDGSAILDCIVFRQESNTKNAMPNIQLGACVSVRGRLSRFKDKIQLTVQAMERIQDPNEEVLWWLQVVETHTAFYASSTTFPAHFTQKALQSKLDLEMGSKTRDSNSILQIHEMDDEALAERFANEVSKFESLSKRDRSHLIPVLKAYIELARMTIIDFGIISNDPSLLRLAEKCIDQALLSSKHVNREKMTHLELSKVFAALSKEGYMYRLESDTQMQDLWQIIRHDLNLGDAVYNAVKKCGTSGLKEIEESGVPYDMVCLAVREKSIFRSVPNSVIKKSLKLLHSQSFIMEVMPNHYKAF
ncbi:CST complex subunit STN1 [Chytriomyces hyalinus]|nr:CST complex subunit STN1 [Chytriomyces hyalinus]